MRPIEPMAVSHRQNLAPSQAGSDFLQGFVSAGVLAAAQTRGLRPKADKRTLRLALQGGTALAAGKAAARAWQRRDLRQTLLAVAAGWAGVTVIDKLLQDNINQEPGHG